MKNGNSLIKAHHLHTSPIKPMNNTVRTPSEIKEALAFQLEDYCRNMNKEDLIRSFIAFLNVDQCEDVKDSLDRDIF